MGSGTWSASAYASTTRAKVDSGSTFDYSRTTAAAAPSDRKAHDLLDPKRANTAGPLDGKNIRESRDSDEHPTVTSIAVGLDVTGSNINDARVIQKKLPELLGLLMRKGLVEHPQISIGAMGDATCDYVPLQFAPFESDNRIDDHLDNIYLEGNGGGNNGESYGLYLYYLAKHTVLDSWEKRGKKGYAFLIADENTLTTSRGQIEKFIGETELEGDLSPEQAFRMAEEHYDVFVLVPRNFAAEIQGSLDFYRNIIGQRAVDLDDSSNVAEVIASLVRAMEGDELDDIDEDLRAIGVGEAARKSVSTALAHVGGGGGSIAVSETPADLDDDDQGPTRL